MRYVLLLYQDAEFERRWADAGDEERAADYAAHGRFAELLSEREALLGGEELALSPMATTVRTRGDEKMVTDGPFAEVAEHLGGFYIVKARDLDEALEFARAAPADTVEVRPLVEVAS